MNTCCNKTEYHYASLVLRLFIALRLFMAGLIKFASGEGISANFSFENYTKKMDIIAKQTYETSFLPEQMCYLYAKPLGYILIIVGIWVALGIASRLSLLVAGLTFLSLSIGLSAMGDDTEVLYIGIQVAICAFALCLSGYNKFSLDGILCKNKVAQSE
jgi:thiosulfate dehydrogenase [quinone] large subunit